LGAEDARAILRHRPVWAVSTLAAPARMPLIPGLFDYVIFDEASQCDIASALPLFARAQKAIVVGDPLQLRHGSEHALMDAAGLPKAGRAMIAQSINSLFDFCGTRPAAARKFLSDQFRSAPSIVGYLNADFYAGKLASRRDNESFRPPNGYRPGLDWQDVQGHAQRENGGTINKAEARHIAGAARKLAEDPTFAGSVGILSPFNSQKSRKPKMPRCRSPFWGPSEIA
jgi:superfamily I DNA and/or RNA helicase